MKLHEKLQLIVLSIIATILIGWMLRVGYIVFMPIAFAFYLAVLVRPMQLGMEKRLHPRLAWASYALTLGVIIGVVWAGLGSIWLSLRVVREKLPDYVDLVQLKWKELVDLAARNNIPLEENLLRTEGALDHVVAFFTASAISLQFLAIILLIILFLVLFMLMETQEWHNKLNETFRPELAPVILSTMQQITSRIRIFMITRTIVSLITGLLGGVMLGVMRVDFALVWGLLFFVLNYIPNIGSIIAGVPPVIVAFLQYGLDGGSVAFIGILAIQQIMGNFIEPRMQGRTLRISPTIVFITIVLWGWIWGVAGLLLALPLTLTFIIICEQIPALKPIAVLMSTEMGIEGDA